MSDKKTTDKPKRNRKITTLGIFAVMIIMLLGTLWMGFGGRNDTNDAVREVSLLYLDELAGRREQVVAHNLQRYIHDIRIALNLMDSSDLAGAKNLRAYQKRIKKTYGLEKFAFVDSKGLIYTSVGTQKDIKSYSFNYRTIKKPEISINNLKSKNKSVIIAIPVSDIRFQGKTFNVCFAEISMKNLLSGVSLQQGKKDSTFCNIYTRDGIALTDVVLGGLSSDDNLLTTMKNAKMESPYTNEGFLKDFKSGKDGVVSFTYNDIQETLAYIPIEGTDWMLTYLIRESVISDQISSISSRSIMRSMIQTLLTAAVLILMFYYMQRESRRNQQLEMERATQDAENIVKQEELERRLELQGELLEQEKLRAQQDNMITAMASDYRGVYYVNLDTDEGICYRTDPSLKYELKEGQQFTFSETFTRFASDYVAEEYREGFLEFIKPENIRKALEKHKIITYRYLSVKDGKEFWEMLRFGGVRDANDESGQLNEVGAGFTNIDLETRQDMARNRALSDALDAAEDANRAKTAFLSNMSHEIRTPMNAIIGLDNIAMNDPETPEKTREYLEKIDGSAKHLLTLINDILDMSRIESGRMTIANEEFSFQKMLEQINTIISGQCSEKGLKYECRISEGIEDYYIGDDTKLRQIIINILGNAVKFTPTGGNIDFCVEKTAEFDGKSTLRFTMKDTGIGMSEEFLETLFDAFTQEDSSNTTKYGSSGLGMAITKSLVDMMNGQIDVKSKKNEGTTFTVTVTLEQSERQTQMSDEDIDPTKMKVLVVDNDSVACEHAKLVLEKLGIATETCLSGKEAVEKVKLRHARRDPYNLILVDWKMPEMDGVETTRTIRELIGHESAIIILTAYRWDDILDEAVAAGVDSFLAKPLFASSVMEEFSKAAARKNIAQKKEENKAELKGRKILLAEDVQINADIIMMLLSSRGIEVEHAVNGKVCVEMFEKSEDGYYDAVLMDMRMPEMDGLTATQKIRMLDRSDSKSIPIIALTANAFDDDVQRSLQAGLNAHLTKPVEPENLFETLESLIKD